MLQMTVILPIYNESALAEEVLARVLEHAERHPDRHMVVIDDASSDDTAEIIDSILARRPHPRVEFIRHPTNRGKAEAVITGIRRCRSRMVSFIDGDLAYDLDHVDLLCQALEDADVAIGSRSLSRESQSNISFNRRCFGEGFNLLVRTILGVSHRDTQAGLKGFRLDAALRLFGALRTRSFAFDAEILYLARRLDMRVAEVPALVSKNHSYQTSSIDLIKDPLAMLWAIIKVRSSRAGRAIPRTNIQVDPDVTVSEDRLEIETFPAGMQRKSVEEPMAG